jgi:hypothetical protein
MIAERTVIVFPWSQCGGVDDFRIDSKVAFPQFIGPAARAASAIRRLTFSPSRAALSMTSGGLQS